MKLRVRGNSIRLRLTRGELEQFAASGHVEESVDFRKTGQLFTYSLRIDPEAKEIAAGYENGLLQVLVPKKLAVTWTGSDQVGIGSPEGFVPRILIEKDFVCLTVRPGEDESDMFPNPAGAECRQTEQ